MFFRLGQSLGLIIGWCFGSGREFWVRNSLRISFRFWFSFRLCFGGICGTRTLKRCSGSSKACKSKVSVQEPRDVKLLRSIGARDNPDILVVVGTPMAIPSDTQSQPCSVWVGSRPELSDAWANTWCWELNLGQVPNCCAVFPDLEIPWFGRPRYPCLQSRSLLIFTSQKQTLLFLSETQDHWLYGKDECVFEG